MIAAMGRPPLHMDATTVRFPKKTLDKIDALVGEKGRAKFIREAVEARLIYMERLQDLDRDKQ